jgi:hypothetical protein
LANPVVVVAKLIQGGLHDFALTGSLATEIQLGESTSGQLNDIDIVVRSFDAIPAALADAFLFRHIHPRAIDGKTLMQLVDADQAIRVDIFSECGSTIERSHPVSLGDCVVQCVSLEDLAARAARVVLDLASDVAVPRKHAEHFLRLAPATNPDLVEIAWREHRKHDSPATFREAAELVRGLIQSRADLLVTPEYSQDVNAICEHCEDVAPFRRTSPQTILPILGYC